MLRAAAFFCTCFISVSQNAEKSWFGSGHLYDENLHLSRQGKHFTVYNAVDVNRIRQIKESVNLSEARSKLEIPATGFIFGAVSRLRYEKGIDILVRAFTELVKEEIDVHLLIIGTGPDETALKNLVSDFQITKNVTFFGEANWEQAMEQMAIMDVVVVPSRFEGFGLTAAEAMSMGKAIITTSVFGLVEVVGNTGILVEPNEIKTLTNAMKEIYQNLNLRMDLGFNGSIRAGKLFDNNIYYCKTKILYQNIAKDKINLYI